MGFCTSSLAGEKPAEHGRAARGALAEGGENRGGSTSDVCVPMATGSASSRLATAAGSAASRSGSSAAPAPNSSSYTSVYVSMSHSAPSAASELEAERLAAVPLFLATPPGRRFASITG